MFSMICSQFVYQELPHKERLPALHLLDIPCFSWKYVAMKMHLKTPSVVSVQSYPSMISKTCKRNSGPYVCPFSHESSNTHRHTNTRTHSHTQTDNVKTCHWTLFPEQFWGRWLHKLQGKILKVGDFGD